MSLGCGNKVSKSIPQRVVSLVPSVTEILFALGAEERLVGVTAFCDYPEEARLKPKVGDFSNPSLERILRLEPDIVFATAPEQLRIVGKLRNLGITTEVVNPESVGAVIETVRRIGGLVHRNDKAEEIIDEIVEERRRLGDLVKKVRRRPRVYVELDVNPLFTVGRGSFVNELVELAGGENIVESGMPYLTVNPEIIVANDPEVIVLVYSGRKEEVSSRIGWNDISAIRNGRVYDDVDEDLIARPGPRCIKGALELFKRFHPVIQ